MAWSGSSQVKQPLQTVSGDRAWRTPELEYATAASRRVMSPCRVLEGRPFGRGSKQTPKTCRPLCSPHCATPAQANRGTAVVPPHSHLMSPPASSDHVCTHLGGCTGAQVDTSSSSPRGGRQKSERSKKRPARKAGNLGTRRSLKSLASCKSGLAVFLKDLSHSVVRIREHNAFGRSQQPVLANCKL